MKKLRWFLGLVGIIIGAIIVIRSPMPLFHKYFTPILFCAFMALYRIMRGPTAADRSVAVDILGILVIAVCGLLAVFTHKSWYMDIAIAWALQSFIGVLALAKYLEGRDFDD
jgi:multicomponent Na+:H+ antiporter subunit F